MYIEISDGIVIVICIAIVAIALIKQLFSRK